MFVNWKGGGEEERSLAGLEGSVLVALLEFDMEEAGAVVEGEDDGDEGWSGAIYLP